MIEVTLVSMGPLAEWGPGQIAPVAPPSRRPWLYMERLYTSWRTHVKSSHIEMHDYSSTIYTV